MTKGMQIFNNEEFGQVRTINDNGEVWFVGKDVAEALGYKDTKHAILDHVLDEDRVNSKTQGQNAPELGQRGAWLINESGLYSLILSSKLPNARKFKRWVTSEVLPQIRQTGGYIPMQSDDMDDNEIMAKALLIANKTIEFKTLQINKLNNVIEEQKPKVVFADSVMATDDTISIYGMAKILKQHGHNIGGKRLFRWLREHGYLISRKGISHNLPTQKAMEKGLLRIAESTRVLSNMTTKLCKTPRVTGKGQNYFVNLFDKISLR